MIPVGSIRLKKVEEGFKKAQEGTRSFKNVQEGSRRLKKA